MPPSSGQNTSLNSFLCGEKRIIRRVRTRAAAGGPPPPFVLHFLFVVRQIPHHLSDMLVVLPLGPFSGARSRARLSIPRRLVFWWLHGEVMRRLSRRMVGF
ncbi:hypothetical protein F2Q70_00015082 [Brassica cretica]|uniref:Uncharacterized protein n=1 Tax=Brassica cretica TaxID=69181 RepID=A0A8S9HXM4_BRACR|nr:hypothetical protein F2Q70_00015082 [Brassica cretica]